MFFTNLKHVCFWNGSSLIWGIYKQWHYYHHDLVHTFATDVVTAAMEDKRPIILIQVNKNQLSKWARTRGRRPFEVLAKYRKMTFISSWSVTGWVYPHVRVRAGWTRTDMHRGYRLLLPDNKHVTRQRDLVGQQTLTTSCSVLLTNDHPHTHAHESLWPRNKVHIKTNNMQSIADQCQHLWRWSSKQGQHKAWIKLSAAWLATELIGRRLKRPPNECG